MREGQLIGQLGEPAAFDGHRLDPCIEANGTVTDVTPSVIALTGHPGRAPLAPPPELLDSVALLGDALGVDALGALTERARLLGFERRGTTTCGGAGRLLRAADGWIAVSLARPSDLDALSAWLGRDVALPGDGTIADEGWESVAAAVAATTTATLVELGSLLGLPVGSVGEVAWDGGAVVGRRRIEHRDAQGRAIDGLHVVDCSSLWAGPLCARTLQRLGARVTRLESSGRPDGARSGSPEFYAALHDDQVDRTIDLTSADGRAEWEAILASADVVIEGSRPRAFEQLGISAERLLASAHPLVWISITAYGRVAAPHRVGFGDDCAAAGGLVAWGDEGPCFVGDAIADPLTGLFAAHAAVTCLERGGRWLLDASLARCAAFSARGAGTRSPLR